MSDGCGFIPDEMMLRLVGGGTGALEKKLRRKSTTIHVAIGKSTALWPVVTAAARNRGFLSAPTHAHPAHLGRPQYRFGGRLCR